jgi:hypothetical protein
MPLTETRFGFLIVPKRLNRSPLTFAEVERLILCHDRSLDWSQPPAGAP